MNELAVLYELVPKHISCQREKVQDLLSKKQFLTCSAPKPTYNAHIIDIKGFDKFLFADRSLIFLKHILLSSIRMMQQLLFP